MLYKDISNKAKNSLIPYLMHRILTPKLVKYNAHAKRSPSEILKRYVSIQVMTQNSRNINIFYIL